MKGGGPPPNASHAQPARLSKGSILSHPERACGGSPSVRQHLTSAHTRAVPCCEKRKRRCDLGASPGVPLCLWQTQAVGQETRTPTLGSDDAKRVPVIVIIMTGSWEGATVLLGVSQGHELWIGCGGSRTTIHSPGGETIEERPWKSRQSIPTAASENWVALSSLNASLPLPPPKKMNKVAWQKKTVSAWHLQLLDLQLH